VEFFVSLFGNAFGAAIVAGLFGMWQWRQNRKAQKEDKAADQNVANCAARGLEIQGLQVKVNSLIVADRTILYDRIKHLAKSYLCRGWVTVEELEDLNRMHEVYHDSDKLNGNGFLKDLMDKVNNSLNIRAA
jgi:hypothetical protein